MSKKRMNERDFSIRFVGKTKKECELLAKELIEKCERNGQAAIAFRALQKRFGGYEEQQLKEIQLDHEAVRKEAATGAIDTYLQELFGISKTKLKEILAEGKKTTPDLEIIPEVRDDTVSAFEELMIKAKELDEIPEDDEPEEEMPIVEDLEPEKEPEEKKKSFFNLK